jgi:hypothetical protein
MGRLICALSADIPLHAAMGWMHCLTMNEIDGDCLATKCWAVQLMTCQCMHELCVH